MLFRSWAEADANFTNLNTDKLEDTDLASLTVNITTTGTVTAGAAEIQAVTDATLTLKSTQTALSGGDPNIGSIDFYGSDASDVGAGVKSSITSAAEAVTGTELVTNGTFDTDTDWTKGTGWTISGGVASIVGGANNSLNQDLSLDETKAYEITLTVSNYAQGTLVIRAGDTSTNLVTINANGTYTNTIIPEIGRAHV